MRITKDEPERKTLVVPKQPAQPSRETKPVRPANEPLEQPQVLPERKKAA